MDLQLPAFLLPGVCLVVSPLVALMQDQLSRLPPLLPGGLLCRAQGRREGKRCREGEGFTAEKGLQRYKLRTCPWQASDTSFVRNGRYVVAPVKYHGLGDVKEPYLFAFSLQ